MAIITGGEGRVNSTGAGSAATGGNLAEQALSAALSYRTHAPTLDSLLQEVELSGGSLNALTAALPEHMAHGIETVKPENTTFIAKETSQSTIESAV